MCTYLARRPSDDVFGVTIAIGTGEGLVDEGMGTTEITIANPIKLYSECTHSAVIATSISYF